MRLPRFKVRSLMIAVLVVAVVIGSAMEVVKHFRRDQALRAELQATQLKLDGWLLYAHHRYQAEVCRRAMMDDHEPYNVTKRLSVEREAKTRFPSHQTFGNTITDHGGWRLEGESHQYWADRLHDVLVYP